MVSTTDVVAIDDPSDGDDSLLFRLSDDCAILVRGLEDMPNDDFSIVRLPETRVIVNIELRGSRTPVLHRVPNSVDTGKLQTGDLLRAKWGDICAGSFAI